MKTRLTNKLILTYSIFLIIILIISIFTYIKLNEINSIFHSAIREYELILRINRVKIEYFEDNNLHLKNDEEIKDLNIELREIREMLEKVLEENEMFNVPDLTLPGTQNYNERVLTFINHSENTLRNLYEINMQEVQVARNTLMVFVSFTFIFGIFLTFYFSLTISRPINNLLKAVRKSEGDKITKVDNKLMGGDEFELLNNEFNQLLKKVNNSKKELSRMNENLEIKLKKKAEEINEINKRMYHHQKLSALGRLVSGIAHEIKNPLNVMLNILPDIKTEDKETVAVLRKQINRINVLVSGFLDYARYEKYSIKKFDFINSLQSVVSFFQRANKNINVIMDNKTGNDIIINGDENRLEQAFLNLLVNSKESMQNNIEPEITVEIKCIKNKVQIKFRDNGIGIQKSNIQKVFEPFFTTKKEGNGLGLAIVYNIIKFHKGSIEIDSRRGEYTEFTICLNID
ncbi:MAG: ATP-binding protein [Candidatus Muiribacteriota bacterium]